MKKILTIAAHPDDEILGCGATMARHTLEGDEVHILICGEGITSRENSKKEEIKDGVKKLHEKSLKASRLIKAKSHQILNFPDNQMDSVPLLKVVQSIEKVISQVKPDIIYTHHGGDLNVDHQIVFKATLTATRPGCGSHQIQKIIAYEVPSSTEWSFQKIQPVFSPNFFVDVSSTLDTKIKAMQCYDSEMRDFPHPRSEKALRAIALRWGSVSGLNAAEAFEIIREIKDEVH